MVHPEKQYQVQHALQHTVMLEGEMVDRNKYGAIRCGVPKKQIARQLEVTVKTVRRALKKPHGQTLMNSSQRVLQPRRPYSLQILLVTSAARLGFASPTGPRPRERSSPA